MVMAMTMSEFDKYLTLPYTRTIKRDEDGDFVAEVSEFPGCAAHGATEVEALESLAAIVPIWIKQRLTAGLAIPQPSIETPMPSGKWVQRVPRSLHKRLVDLAAKEETSLNQLVTGMLATGVAVIEEVWRVPPHQGIEAKEWHHGFGRARIAKYRIIGPKIATTYVNSLSLPQLMKGYRAFEIEEDEEMLPHGGGGR
jgi:antitoxin HicB